VTAPRPFVPGIEVGHATAYGGRSGCTVVLGPFRAVAEVRGLATGSRELHVLHPEHLVQRVDAILLTGGSAFGLAAADGVVRWLSESGRGFDTGVVRVPIVPAAVIFDLRPHHTRPDAETGHEACVEARPGHPPEGLVGAGAGATVGKVAGPDAAMAGGFGAWSEEVDGHRVGALVVVNGLGDVLDGQGRIVAGARGPDGFLDSAEQLRRGGVPGTVELAPGTNTTLAIVATDAPLSRVALARLVRVAANALPRRIDPVHTPFDGDVVFAVSTAEEEREPTAAEVLSLGAMAQHALEEAITRAVTTGLREHHR